MEVSSALRALKNRDTQADDTEFIVCLPHPWMSAKTEPRAHIAIEIVLHVSNRKLTSEVVYMKRNLLTQGNAKFWRISFQVQLVQELKCR